VQDLAALEDVVLKVDGPTGTPVLVKDVGTVRFGPTSARADGVERPGEAVGGVVVMRYGENALEVIDRVKEKLEELRPGLPEGVKVEIAYDRSDLIHRSIATLRHALVEEAVVVALVISCSCCTCAARCCPSSPCRSRSPSPSSPCTCWTSRPPS
jgi:Cu(I)/Ag(I) efflux system membrane protein CusA/SilA